MGNQPSSLSRHDVRRIRHTAEVQAESLYDVVVLAVRVFRSDPWLERTGPATIFDVEVIEPLAKHSISVQQVEHWLAGTPSSPNASVKKAKLKMLLVSR